MLYVSIREIVKHKEHKRKERRIKFARDAMFKAFKTPWWSRKDLEYAEIYPNVNDRNWEELVKHPTKL